MKNLISLLSIAAYCFTFISTNAQMTSEQEKNISGAWVSQDGKEFSIMITAFFHRYQQIQQVHGIKHTPELIPLTMKIP